MCDNPKVLEVILEHILFHWDDIVETFINELLEEEVLELNNIEKMKKGENKRANSRLSGNSLKSSIKVY